jgi:5-dehydro-4-deoxyglucarate dehydratase
MNPQELKSIMGSGLLSFPITDFDEQGEFRPKKRSSSTRSARAGPRW